ncbi:MAG: DNA-directed RNA polymerase subunit alpha [Parcubacteria group bacterium GW2011_GWA1_42_7]|nr:MAG: DNA-directed RNA polymerase subunit alpha [Parcubacteria group bacterium GW2011_GWB1_42_6]KKS70170.1 MAG: DNA-directed RNA polymerase subunit alpha [Parcubacteria group bacterium GW2011_GWA1_42_7]KKS92418.1 MAG: DNA-directed RNA polymerase subunit alpha, DNA-directed RNA polymerase subunit alpha [Parcubacteria group bacterium GW2011_GWC1_43_12]
MQINLPQSTKQIKSEHNRAIFEVEGLYPGYGVTLGNALRRALLSSLKGAAITGVKIKGAQHEFSAIPGISEDVIEIILNLRQIRFKLHSDEPVKLNLSVKGEKEVKASDIQTTSEVEIINPEARIATLNDKKAELEMEIEVESGFGFVPVEIRRKEKLEIGLIAVDAVFAPIKKVNFEVENMRVGDRTDFNRLRLDIETDGSITPQDAFHKSCEILVAQFNSLIGEKKEEEESGQKEEEAQDSGKIKIEDLKLSTRTANALAEAGIKTAGGLAKKTEDSLREMEGMGEKGITEVKKALKKLGLGLKEEV